MKKQSLIIIGCLALGLVIMSQCKDGDGGGKPLFFQEDGNYVVDNNFIVKTAVPMSSADVQQLISLDTAYAKLTKGTAILTHIANKLQILRVAEIAQLDRIVRLQQIDRITRILDFQKGCLQVAQIDWAQYGDLKAKLDGIFAKYKPATLDGNYSIYNNNIATAVASLDAKSIGALSGITIRGADEADICGEYMGVKAFTKVLTHSVNSPFNVKSLAKVNQLLLQYK